VNDYKRGDMEKHLAWKRNIYYWCPSFAWTGKL